ncbi:MAG: GHKL domain-containing protein [Proteobacteria bacterium]|nr:GHKL domain-containing protein [Pseudomonadota bacterium]MBU1710152.1 GHKL domain-containing protein [Pseudomonadota bacterium]
MASGDGNRQGGTQGALPAVKMYFATIPGEVMKQKPRADYYSGQKRIFSLVIILLAILPLIFINWNSSKLFQDSWLTKTENELSSFSESRKELIDLFLANQEDLLGGLLQLFMQEELSRVDRLEKVFFAVNRNNVMTDLGVIDGAGRHLAYVGPFTERLVGKNYADSPWFVEVMKQGRYVSDVFTGYRGVPHLVVAVASQDRSWLLRATINSEMFNALVASANVGPNGDAFIISRQGEMQTTSRLGQTIFDPGHVRMLHEIASRGVKVTSYNNYLYAVAPLNRGNWLLVLKTDIPSSLKDFYQARKIGLTVIVGTALLILIVARLVINPLVNKIERAEEQRMNLTDKVREVEKMALIGRLAASVAHEINNPLQVISAQAGWINELLEQETEGQAYDHQEALRAIEKIRTQVRRAGGITKRLLGFAGSDDGEWFETDINKIVEETINLLEKEACSNRIIIKREYAEGLPVVRTEATQLQQVFLNILNNAIDAIGSEGVITVSTLQVDGRIHVQFADTGPGIPEHDTDKIFQPFYTTKEKGKGTGLGLLISRNIMQKMNGDLEVVNREQGGCLFTVSLSLNNKVEVQTHEEKL